MRTLVYGLLIIVLTVIQATFSNLFGAYTSGLNLPLIFAFCLSMVKNERSGFTAGFISGFLQDALFGTFIGMNTIAISVSAYIVGLSSKNLYKGRAVITMMLVFIGSVIFKFIFVVIALFTGQLTSSPQYIMSAVILPPFANMIISPLIYLLTYRIEDFFDFYFNLKY